MRIFEEFGKGNKCPICKTGKKGKAILIPMVGTGDSPEKKFQNYEAMVFHLDCISLWYDKKMGILYQKILEE